MSALGLAAHQLRYEQKSYWRNPASALFTFAFPVMFLVIFASLNAGQTIDFLGGLKYNQYYTPGIIAFGIISACFTNLAMTLSIRRDAGILKRMRGTPLPSVSLFGGLVANSIVISAILTAIVTTVGMLFYGVTFPGHWLALLVALVSGVVCFCSLGVAMSSLVANADAAPAVVNGVLFPVLFISGVFFPVRSGTVFATVADVFPVRHFTISVFAAFDPRVPHTVTQGFAWDDIAIVLLWGLVGAVVAVRRFRWEPRR
jgi:ABC-2 type transport system permease protein